MAGPAKAPGRRRPGPVSGRGVVRLPVMSEAELQAAIMQLAGVFGWRRAHFRPAQLPSGRWATHMEGETGWPDLVLARPGRLLIYELKRDGKDPTPEQEAWLNVLRTVPGIRVGVWRPEDWRSGEIERILRP